MLVAVGDAGVLYRKVPGMVGESETHAADWANVILKGGALTRTNGNAKDAPFAVNGPVFLRPGQFQRRECQRITQHSAGALGFAWAVVP